MTKNGKIFEVRKKEEGLWKEKIDKFHLLYIVHTNLLQNFGSIHVVSNRRKKYIEKKCKTMKRERGTLTKEKIDKSIYLMLSFTNLIQI